MSNVELCVDRCIKIYLGDKYYELPKEMQLSTLVRCMYICSNIK